MKLAQVQLPSLKSPSIPATLPGQQLAQQSPAAPSTTAATAGAPVYVAAFETAERQCGYPPGAVWFSAEFLLWWTSGNRLPPLLTTSPPGTPFAQAGVLGVPGTSVLFGDSFVDNGLRSGGRFTAGFWFNDDHTTGAEANFFFLENTATSIFVASDGIPILARPFFDFTPTNNGTPDSLKVAYPGVVKGDFAASTFSSFLGGDVYIRQALCCGCCCRLDALAGYRTLQLRDRLHISETETATDPQNPLFGIPIFMNENFATGNNFHGGELGLIGEFARNWWWVRVVGKVGLGANCRNASIFSTTQVDGLAAEAGGFLGLPSNIGTYNSTAFSVVPEVGVNAGAQITPRLRGFVGYTFLLWSGVTRTGDIIDLGVNTTQPPLGGGLVGPARPQFSFGESSFWAQGINFGLEFRY